MTRKQKNRIKTSRRKPDDVRARQDRPRRDSADQKQKSDSGTQSRSPVRQSQSSSSSYWIYGKHALHAALDNSERRFVEIRATEKAIDELASRLDKRQLSCRISTSDEISTLLSPDATHQGVAAKVHPLPVKDVKDVIPSDSAAPCRLLLLDQITDPHNLGAILRSAAAFDVHAVLVTERNAPPVSGVVAKSACGALDIVPLVHIGNLARTLDELAENGFWRVGLTGHTDKALHEIDPGNRIALVLGAEGKGMRRLTSEKCDFLVKLPISPKMESLNVSNAAAIALYELSKDQEF